MANLRRYTNQFMNSFERQPVMLMGSASQTGSVGTFATIVSNGITYTADRMGTAGNSITIEIVAGGTAGAEVVTVTNSLHIKVVIESTVSTRTQVKTAIDANAAAAALVDVSVASGGTAASLLAQTALATGISTPISMNAQAFTVSQIGTGLYEMVSQAPFSDLLSMSIMLQRASSVDLQAQIKSVSASTRTIVFRMIAGSTNTNMASGDVLYIQSVLRPSANPS